MNAGKHSLLLTIVRAAAWAACGLFSSAAALAANPAVASVQVVATPNPASVSRVDQAFFVTYKVTISNTANASVNYKLVGTTSVKDTAGNVISVTTANFKEASAYVTSRGGRCKTPNPSNLTAVECADIDVNKNTPQTIAITFFTPAVVNNNIPGTVELAWSVSFQNQAPVAATAVAPLTTVPFSQSTTEFSTFVPTTGGIFFTGFSAGAGAPVGGKATGLYPYAGYGDPYSTTVAIPSISNSTTATATESMSATNPNPSGCQNYYWNCFGTALSIPNIVYPSTSTNKFITIFLRIDASQIKPLATSLGILAIPIYYQHTATSIFAPLPTCASNPLLPLAGQPCIVIDGTKVYGNDSSVPFDFRGDWQWEIRAVDNGRFIV